MLTLEQHSRKSFYKLGYLFQLISIILLFIIAFLFLIIGLTTTILYTYNSTGEYGSDPEIVFVTIISSISILLPLTWMIPMTLMMKRAMKDVGTIIEKPHLTLGICAIIFSGILPGIFISIGAVSFNSEINVKNNSYLIKDDKNKNK